MSAATAAYREHDPGTALRPWVECLWTRDVGTAERHRVLPDGCADVLVVVHGAAARALAVGPMTEPHDAASAAGCRYVAVRFRPGAARAFLGVPLAELLDQRVTLDAIWGGAARELAETVARAGDPVSALRAALLRRPPAGPPDALVSAAVRRLAADGSDAAVARLASELGVSRQHLARRFRDEVGHGPKKLARVVRMQRALQLVAGERALALAELALAAGYYDQAHLGAELRALAGTTPTRARAAFQIS